MQSARGMIVDGEDIRREINEHGVDDSLVRVMYASIDTERYNSGVSVDTFCKLLAEKGMKPEGGPLLVYCGRLVFMNRPLDFLEVLKNIPEARGVIIGDGPDRRALEKEAEQLEGRALFLGHQQETMLASAFRVADVCLFPLSEKIAGISLVVPKAMACGAPVITNRVADITHLVEHEKNGLLCDEGNLPEWIEATQRLLEDSDLRNRLGHTALETIQKNWTEDVRAREYSDWLDSLVSPRGQA
jgi:glycosyltransferase involved in cell wall biosynthesis